MLRTCALLVLAAGCGGTAVVGQRANLDTCPPADAIRYAEWLPAEANTYGRPGQGAWAIRLGFRSDGERAPAAGAVDPSAIYNHGFEVMPSRLWILRAGHAPCLAQVTGYAADIVEDGPRNTRLSALAEGCAPAAGEVRPIAWVTVLPDEPRACTLVTPDDAGRFAADESRGGFAIPDQHEPVPAPWAEVVPAATETCGPSCATLWDLRATATEPSIGELTVTRITPGAPDDQCGWPAEDHHAIVEVATGAAPRELELPPGDAGPGDAMTLAGVLVDGGRARVLLFTDLSEWAAYPLTDDGVGAGRRARTYMPHEEDYVYRSLAPYCGP